MPEQDIVHQQWELQTKPRGPDLGKIQREVEDRRMRQEERERIA